MGSVRFGRSLATCDLLGEDRFADWESIPELDGSGSAWRFGADVDLGARSCVLAGRPKLVLDSAAGNTRTRRGPTRSAGNVPRSIQFLIVCSWRRRRCATSATVRSSSSVSQPGSRSGWMNASSAPRWIRIRRAPRRIAGRRPWSSQLRTVCRLTLRSSAMSSTVIRSCSGAPLVTGARVVCRGSSGRCATSTVPGCGRCRDQRRPAQRLGLTIHRAPSDGLQANRLPHHWGTRATGHIDDSLKHLAEEPARGPGCLRARSPELLRIASIRYGLGRLQPLWRIPWPRERASR